MPEPASTPAGDSGDEVWACPLGPATLLASSSAVQAYSYAAFEDLESTPALESFGRDHMTALDGCALGAGASDTVAFLAADEELHVCLVDTSLLQIRATLMNVRFERPICVCRALGPFSCIVGLTSGASYLVLRRDKRAAEKGAEGRLREGEGVAEPPAAGGAGEAGGAGGHSPPPEGAAGGDDGGAGKGGDAAREREPGAPYQLRADPGAQLGAQSGPIVDPASRWAGAVFRLAEFTDAVSSISVVGAEASGSSAEQQDHRLCGADFDLLGMVRGLRAVSGVLLLSMSGELAFFDEALGSEAAAALEALCLRRAGQPAGQGGPGVPGMSGGPGAAGEASGSGSPAALPGALTAQESSLFSLACQPAFQTRIVAASVAANQSLATYTRPAGSCNGAYLLLPGKPVQLRPLADTSHALQLEVQPARRKYGAAGDWMSSLILPSPEAASRLRGATALACAFFPPPYQQASCAIYTTDARLYICRLRYAAPHGLEVLAERQFEPGTHLNQILFFVDRREGPGRAGAGGLGLCLFLVMSHDAIGKTITRLDHLERYVPQEGPARSGKEAETRKQLGDQLRQAVRDAISGAAGKPASASTARAPAQAPESEGVVILDDESSGRPLSPDVGAEAGRESAEGSAPRDARRGSQPPAGDEIDLAVDSSAVPSHSVSSAAEASQRLGGALPASGADPLDSAALERERQVQESLRLQRLEERLLGRLEGALEQVIGSVAESGQVATGTGRQASPPCLLLPGFHAVFENRTYTPASVLSYTVDARRELLRSAERVTLCWNAHGRVDGAQYILVTPSDSSKHAVKTSLVTPALHADIKEDGYCLLRPEVLTVHPYTRSEWRATFSPSKTAVICALGSQSVAAVGFADGTVIVYRHGFAVQTFTVAALAQRRVEEDRRGGSRGGERGGDRVVDRGGDRRGLGAGAAGLPFAGPGAENERLYSLLADGDLLAVLTTSSVYVLDTFAQKLAFFAHLPFSPTFADFAGSVLFIGSRDGDLSALNLLSTFEAAQCAWTPVFSCREYEYLRVRKLHAAIEAATARRDGPPLRMAEISKLSPVFYHPLYVSLESLGANTMGSGRELLEEFIPRDLLDEGASVSASASSASGGQASRRKLAVTSSPAFSLSVPFTLSCLEVPNADPRFTLAMDTLTSHIYNSSSTLDLASLKRFFSQDLAALARDFPIRVTPHLRASALDSSAGVRILALTPPVNALQDGLDFFERAIHVYGLLLNGALASYATSEDTLVLLEKNFDLIVMSYAREALLGGFPERARIAGRLLRTRRALARYPGILASSGQNEMADEFSTLYSQLFGVSDDAEVYSVRQTETIPGSVGLLGGTSVWAVRSEGVSYGVSALKRGMSGLVQKLRNEILEMRQYHTAVSQDAAERADEGRGGAGGRSKASVIIDDAETARGPKLNPFSVSQSKGEATRGAPPQKVLSGQDAPVAQSTPVRSPFFGERAPQKETPLRKSALDILRKSKR